MNRRRSTSLSLATVTAVAGLGLLALRSPAVPGAAIPDSSERAVTPAPQQQDPGRARLRHLDQAPTAQHDRDRPAFRRQIDSQIDAGDTAERVAALRTWYDSGLQPRLAPFSRVLRSGTAAAQTRPATSQATAQAQAAVREFALRFLLRHARAQPEARRALAEYLDARPQKPRHRVEALYGILRWGDDDELQRQLPRLRGELDPGVLDRAIDALGASDAAAAKTMLLQLEAYRADAQRRQRR